MMDPEFLPGSEHVAHCPVTNPTTKQWTYDAELCLVKDETKYASSGTVSFTLAAGASATVDFPITMPGSEGTYDVYLDIYVAGELIAAYQATEDVVVKAAVANLYGLVTDAETGAPIEGLSVLVITYTTPYKEVASTKTDVNGEYRIEGIEPNRYWVQFNSAFIPEDYEVQNLDKVLVAGENELNLEMIPVPAFETIVDPLAGQPGGVEFRSLSLPDGLIPTDLFTGAELSVYISATYWATRTAYEPSVTFTNEYCLIKGSEAIPIGSISRTMTGGTGSTGVYITLPDEPGTYETMLRIYTNGVLTGQYPYLGPITVIPRGVSNFSYTRPSLTVKWDSWWPGYTYSVTCTITNTGSTAEQKKVVLWLRRGNSWGGAQQWYRKHEFTLTLAPGESYSYSHLPKHNTSDQYWDLVPMAGGNNLVAQIRDSDGGVSEKSYTRTAT